MKASTRGLILIIISGIVFGIQPSAVQYCYQQGAVPVLVLLFRYGILALILLPVVLRQKDTWRYYKEHFWHFLLLGLASSSTPLLIYTAYRFLGTSLATGIHYFYPAVTAILGLIFLREKLSLLKIIALVFSVGGIFIMVDFNEGFHLGGALIALASSVTFASYIVLLRRLKAPGISSWQILFFVAVNSFVFLGIYGLASGDLIRAVPAVTPTGWILLPVVTAVIAVFGTLFFTFGARETDALTSAIASTLEPIVCFLIGIFFLHEPYSVRTIIGAVLVISAVVLLAFAEKIKTRNH